MSGANMFVLYTDASGTNVTLSPRLGTGHVEPEYNSAAQVTILDGTGVSDDTMTVNFRCKQSKASLTLGSHAHSSVRFKLYFLVWG